VLQFARFFLVIEGALPRRVEGHGHSDWGIFLGRLRPTNSYHLLALSSGQYCGWEFRIDSGTPQDAFLTNGSR
jgi:hypothetical protein